MVALWAGIVTLLATTVLTIAGIGAAFILVPVFLALGVALHTAMSTALLLNAISMAFACLAFAREKLILWRLAAPIVVVSVVLAPLGAWASAYVPRDTLLALFALFLVFAATMMLFYRPAAARVAGAAVAKGARGALLLGLPVGGVAGFLGGLLGVGGGNIILPALVSLGISPKQASATTAFIVVFASLAGFFGRVSVGSLDLTLLATTAAGSIAGALLGSWLMSRKMQNRQVKLVIGVLLYAIAAKMLFDLWF
jgi:hypothetical protein